MTIEAVLLPASGKSLEDQVHPVAPPSAGEHEDQKPTEVLPSQNPDEGHVVQIPEPNDVKSAAATTPDLPQEAATTHSLPESTQSQGHDAQNKTEAWIQTQQHEASSGAGLKTRGQETPRLIHPETGHVIPPLDLTKDAVDVPELSPSGTDPASKPEHRRPDSMVMSPLTHPNGVSIFPELSAFEQDVLSTAALFEAEDTIVADSEEASTVGDGRSDAGYESDSITSGSTSMESSIRDYMYENGRRYHRFREGSYNFPNDDVEQEREDMKHAMIKLLSNQKLNFAPIGEHPQEILDIGTGTGIWAIESEYLFRGVSHWTRS